MAGEMSLEQLLREMCEKGASDLHIKVGSPPGLRIDGKIEPHSEMGKLTPEMTETYVREITNENQWMDYCSTGDLDFGHSISGLARFRVNVMRQRGSCGLVIRKIPVDIPTIEDLKLPDLTVADIEFFDERRGLAKLKRFELAANLAKPFDGCEGENLSLRNFNAVTASAYKRILEPLGIDLKTGEGSFGAEHAQAVVDLVMKQKVLLSYLGIVPNSVNYKRPKDSNKFIGQILKLMGLKTSSRKKREEGVLVRRYYLDPDNFASIRKRAVRRRVGAELSHDIPVEDRWTVRHFRQITIQEIDEVPQNELLRLGITAAAE
ncbi:MAG: hypothetical protein IH914_03915, partial [candidate division Zixibacteria bacterium]|nr:hypothetical protein [candidate division Zixibacteria bacterium]